MSCGLTLQICLIIALSFRCRRWRFGFVNAQVSLAWSIALRTQELYTRPHALKEKWGKRELVAAPLTSSRRFSNMMWLKVTFVIRVLCQVLEHTAFLVHPVLAAVAEDAVATHSSAQTAHGNSPELCRRSSPVPQIPAFTLSLFSSIDSLQVKSLLTHSSSDSAMITRSSA